MPEVKDKAFEKDAQKVVEEAPKEETTTNTTKEAKEAPKAKKEVKKDVALTEKTAKKPEFKKGDMVTYQIDNLGNTRTVEVIDVNDETLTIWGVDGSSRQISIYAVKKA